VVAQRQVETGLAGVALTSGAAAKLVVDASRLVPLGAEDVQTARVADLLALLLAGLFPLGEGRLPFDRVLLLVGLVETALTTLGRREELRVAAEQDVGASTG